MEYNIAKRQKIDETIEGFLTTRDVLTPKERAKIHRERKKKYLQNLEVENKQLREKVESLTKQNLDLLAKVKKMEIDKSPEISISAKTSAFSEVKNTTVSNFSFAKFSRLSLKLILFKGDKQKYYLIH